MQYLHKNFNILERFSLIKFLTTISMLNFIYFKQNIIFNHKCICTFQKHSKKKTLPNGYCLVVLFIIYRRQNTIPLTMEFITLALVDSLVKFQDKREAEQ